MPAHGSSRCAARLGQRDDLVDRLGEDRLGQLVLVGEVPVGGADADAGVPGDVVEAGLEAALGEHLARGLDQQRAVARGVLAQRTGGRGRLRSSCGRRTSASVRSRSDYDTASWRLGSSCGDARAQHERAEHARRRRRSRPPTRTPSCSCARPHWPAAAAGRRRAGVRSASRWPAALAAIVLSSAVPTEPPTCWIVLTVADATPESLASTPRVARLNAGCEHQAEADTEQEQRGQDVRGVAAGRCRCRSASTWPSAASTMPDRDRGSAALTRARARC